MGAIWKDMEQCKRAGLAKSIGVSNFTVENLKEVLVVCEFPPAVNQIVFLYSWQSLQPLIEWLLQNDILVVAPSNDAEHPDTINVPELTTPEIELIRNELPVSPSLWPFW
ncbi:hypothetical protein K503DRAFT_67005 [Rhizopogon vinicolor AM-OR11-026]|uniref:NADP-dependent oxidoreductase domain-containing protein n=1 Tax=Rhizopogon vinicolor AM-OR11-026 TaxID=1314800 RepID=A0A1B7NFY7_9AGAM|nr:hypothetical protein K503DRAFT_67005 [Rhizopogon vinicolor AM-OR11-026]